jgi:hypothetical protein
MHDEKRIILYSLPLEWEVPSRNEAAAKEAAESLELEAFGAAVEFVGNGTKVTWPDTRRMGYWFCCVVLLHEFAHHFRSTYRAKRRPGDRIRRGDEEFLADRRAFDAFREVFIRGRSRQLKSGK